jgi:hypothetical protein
VLPQVWRGGQRDWVYRVHDYGANDGREGKGAALADLRTVVLDLHSRNYPQAAPAEGGGGVDGAPGAVAAANSGLPAFLEAQSAALAGALRTLSRPRSGAAARPGDALRLMAAGLVPTLQTCLFAARRELVSHFAPLHLPGYELQAAAARGLLVPADFEPYEGHGGSPGGPMEDLYAPKPAAEAEDEARQETPPPPGSEPRSPPPADDDAAARGGEGRGGVVRALVMTGAKRAREAAAAAGEGDDEEEEEESGGDGGAGRCVRPKTDAAAAAT